MAKEQLNFIFMFLNPGFDVFTMMDSQIIQNQIYLTISILDQALKEFDEKLRVHCLFVDHETNLALIGNRGDQIDPFTPCTQTDGRRLASGGIASPMLTVTAKTGFISPMNLGLLLFGPGCDGWILFIKPFRYHFRVLLICPAQWLLGRIAPTAQIFTYSSDGQIYRQQLFNQLLYGNSRPQGKRQFNWKNILRCYKLPG